MNSGDALDIPIPIFIDAEGGLLSSGLHLGRNTIDSVSWRIGETGRREYNAIYTYRSKRLLVAYGENGFIISFYPDPS